MFVWDRSLMLFLRTVSGCKPRSFGMTDGVVVVLSNQHDDRFQLVTDLVDARTYSRLSKALSRLRDIYVDLHLDGRALRLHANDKEELT